MLQYFILGGFYFNIAISAMLLRPPPTYSFNKNLAEQGWPEIPQNLSDGEKSKHEIAIVSKPHGAQVNLGFENEDNCSEIRALEEEPVSVVKSYIYGTETLKYEQCSTSYQIILTNLAFIRLFFMMMLASFAVFSILYLMPPLAQERGASDVTASLTVTVCGATEAVSR